jgi:hypothetical protein
MRATAEWISKNRLVTILMFAYLLLSGLVVEQGRIIENQRELIHQLFGDSLALNAVRTQSLPGHRVN